MKGGAEAGKTRRSEEGAGGWIAGGGATGTVVPEGKLCNNDETSSHITETANIPFSGDGRFTQISLPAGRALKSALVDEAVREPIRNINGDVKELATALEEIVWAANPSHDSLEGISNSPSQYTAPQGCLRSSRTTSNCRHPNVPLQSNSFRSVPRPRL